MKAEKFSEKKNSNRSIVFQIIYFIGLAILIAALFIPAREDDIIEGYDIPNLFNAFTATVQGSEISFIQMLFGHVDDVISVSPVILDILLMYLPIALFIASIVIVLVAPRLKLGLVLGLIGLAMVIGIDLFLIMTDTSCFGLYLGFVGVIIGVLGLLLFYIDQTEDEAFDEYKVAGEISCRQGEFAGSTFKIPDTVTIGKDPNECNIVLRNRTISRVHCIIKYVPETDTYTVTDVSKNGTFFSGGKPLIRNYEMQVKRGTEIYMGEPREYFYLD